MCVPRETAWRQEGNSEQFRKEGAFVQNLFFFLILTDSMTVVKYLISLYLLYLQNEVITPEFVGL